MDYRLAPYALAVAGEMAGFAPDIALARPGEANHANRLFARAATRPRDAGDRDAHRAPGAHQRALRHLARGFLAHGAVPLERLGAHAEQLALGVVRVGDTAALEPVR